MAGAVVRLGQWSGWDGGPAGMAVTAVRQSREPHGQAPWGGPGWHEGWAERACGTASPVTPAWSQLSDSLFASP